MIKTDGENLLETLGALELDASRSKEMTQKASEIFASISGAVSTTTGAVTGLIYGRIQSGKTQAMITTVALAFDNNYRVAIIITSNINKLVGQTTDDFDEGLTRAIIISKSEFGNDEEAESIKKALATGNQNVVIICSKGTKRLEQIIEFLKKIEANKYPTIIFDDEGDQATLDTNALKRSTKDATTPASKVNSLVHGQEVDSIRKQVPDHVFISVTGTPQGIVLQNIDSESRPQFIYLLEPGKGYVGGDIFFGEEDPNKNALIRLIDRDERLNLFNNNSADIPEGLKESVKFFLIAASAAALKLQWPNKNQGGGYKYLAHPSVSVNDHKTVAVLVRNYLTEIADKLNHQADSPEYAEITAELSAVYNEMRKTNTSYQYPSLDDIVSEIKSKIAKRKVIPINSKNQPLPYGKYFNFLIGGNTLGRGIAVRNLLVTYYVRESKRSNMDTMYQHARMFGYRINTLPFTKVYLPPQLYQRYREIYLSDEALRQYIRDVWSTGKYLPIHLGANINATRKNVLHVTNILFIFPKQQLFPNYPLPKDTDLVRVTEKVGNKLKETFPGYDDKTKGREGIEITTDEAVSLVALIKTAADNSWKDKHILQIIKDLGAQFGNKFKLRSRVSTRRNFGPGDIFLTGMLSGTDTDQGKAEEIPTLWIIEVTASSELYGNNTHFFYPTIVVPAKGKLTVLNNS